MHTCPAFPRNINICMTVSTENVTSPESNKSRNSHSSVQIQIDPESQFEFAPRDTEKSEFLDLVDVGGVAISVESVICAWGLEVLPMLDFSALQGGEDTYDALSCRSFFAKEPLIIGLFCGKWPVKIRHPMGLRHPVPRHVYIHVHRSSKCCQCSAVSVPWTC